ncbi:alpha/beta fold hydrolase, partial [Iamia sp.]|uniref:alpha/beta fold hydrolase n=1 Tax=Iamia sp. TaxID=2722710 RepID=UPI002C454EA5
MSEERIEVDGIPANLYAATDADALLLLGHGGAHSKDGRRFVDLSRQYAEQTGLAVVCIDAVDHGERTPPKSSPGIPREWHSNAIDPMVHDWRRTAEALSSIGPAVAYVGFSMGAIFGLPTVAAMPSMKAAVFVVGGVPTGGGIDDPPLRPLLLRAASQLEHVPVLMLNKTEDEVFSTEGTQAVFDAIPGRRKRLVFCEGDHDDWPTELIRASVTFINQ